MFRNPDIPFTYNYSQPEEYHFSIDSIEMPWEVAQYLKEKNLSPQELEQMRVLDLCAGVGVLVFELNFHNPHLKKIDFVEVQDVYKSHFEKNQKLVLCENSEFKFLNINYEKLCLPEFEKRYQLILCNPPYFFPDQGKMSDSDFKNRCRFFIDSTFEKLIEVIDFCLAMDGEAFMLIRDQNDHGRDILRELRQLTQSRLECENLCMIRETFLLRLSR